jgi:hypothetical protein
MHLEMTSLIVATGLEAFTSPRVALELLADFCMEFSHLEADLRFQPRRNSEMISDGGVVRDSDNLAWPGHPVVQEIIKRKTILRTASPQLGCPLAKIGAVVEGGAMRGVYSAGEVNPWGETAS